MAPSRARLPAISSMALEGQILRNRYVLIADVLAIALAAWIAFALRFDWLFMRTRDEFPPFLGAAIATKVAVFLAFGLYYRFWRYASFWDLMAVVMANTVGSLVLGVAMVLLLLADLVPMLPRSVLPLDWLFCLALTTAVRASIRVLAESSASSRVKVDRRSRKVLVIGAGDAGAMVVREMQKNPQLGMTPVGFLDDDPAKRRKRIYGVPVVGPLNQLAAVIEARPVDEVVIALPRAGGAVVRAVLQDCQRHGITSRVMPGLYELLDGRFGVSRLREVDIADLLRRPQITTEDGIARYLAGSAIVVTGAGGSIGSELCRQIAHASPRELVVIGHGENSIFAIEGELRTRFPQVPVRSVIADVRDRDRLVRVLQTVKPDVVFHAAAHKHVPLMEENISEAISNNVLGTRNVVEAAVAAQCPRLVLISTDKAAAPSTVMGASKRIAELIVRDAARTHNLAYVVVRFGNVLGSRGSVVPLFKAQIERGGPVTVTHPEVRRYFMTIPEAVNLVLQAGGLGTGGELFVLDMGEPVLLREMAADMIRLSGFTADEVPIVFTGLRPGEKLDEVLWEPRARVVATEQADIRSVIEPDNVSREQLADLVAALVQRAAVDEAAALRLLEQAIPSATLTAKPQPWGAQRATPFLRKGSAN